MSGSTSSNERIWRGRMVSALDVLAPLASVEELDAGQLETVRRVARLLEGLSHGPDELDDVVQATRSLTQALEHDLQVQHELQRLCRDLQQHLAVALQDADTVLIVEDEPGMQEVMTDSLDAFHQWNLISASSVKEAQEALAEHEISLVVLDLNLPDGDGRDVLAFIAALPSAEPIPVVITSGMGGAQVTEALALGADAYLPKPFDPHVLNVTVARLLSKRAETSRQTRIDALTGLPNRVALGESFRQAQAISARTGEPFTLAILDLNAFKAINDTHGHLVGDQVLRWFAETMRRALRGGDGLARWGGDEFVALLPNTRAEGGLAVLERCLDAVDANPMRGPNGHPLRIGFSAGVVEVTRDHTLEQALSEADRRLYRMKSTGRFELPQLS